ncbi:MAG: sulfite exporter TauE/SafE family protein, partial [Gemmatimonadales bacterium]|nr:sulfite exporter TauE/SafE family protein [Gemmatimonadales bacterium]
LSAYFVIGVSMSLVGLHFVGMFGTPEILLSLSLLPGVLVGYLASRHTAAFLDRGYVRTGVLLVSGASALAVLIRHLR